MHSFFWKNGERRFSPLAIAGFVVGGIILAAAFALFFGWIVLLLWNWLMPEIFGLPRIGYWQAWGLVLLSHILVKGGFGRGPHGHGPHGWHHGRMGRGWKDELRTHFDGEDSSAAKTEDSARTGSSAPNGGADKPSGTTV
jgi:hypothetical protein